MTISRKQIIITSIIVEGFLVLISLAWIWYRDVSIFDALSAHHVFQGFAFSLPLLFFNYILFGPPSEQLQVLQPCRDFRERIVQPLADALNVPTALFVSCLAGFSEELFFRGMIQTEFGIVVASLLFALLHFGPAIRSFIFVGVIYLLFGFYFGALFTYAGSLWPPIITHAVYDFIVLLALKHSKNVNKHTLDDIWEGDKSKSEQGT